MACARTVAVVVPSPATSLVLLATSRTICAPMFSKLGLEDSKDVVLSNDEPVFSIDLHLGSVVFPEQHPIAGDARGPGATETGRGRLRANRNVRHRPF